MADNMTQKALVDKALAYADAGVRVFSVTADGKAPNISNEMWSKRLGVPIRRGMGGLKQATTDSELIEWMFTRRSAGGIAMPCGRENNVIVADFDIHKEAPGGNAHQVLLEYEDEIEATHRVRTRNGGLHAYFSYAPGHGKFELGENIEVQSDGAYVLLPPSKGYRVEHLVWSDEWQPPPWPAVESKAADARLRRDLSGETPPEVKEMIRRVEANDGQWHNAMVALTAHLVGSGWGDAEILRHALGWSQHGYSHAETFEEVAIAVAGARQKYERKQILEEREANAVDVIRKNVPKLTKKQLQDLHAAIGRLINE